MYIMLNMILVYISYMDCLEYNIHTLYVTRWLAPSISELDHQDDYKKLCLPSEPKPTTQIK